MSVLSPSPIKKDPRLPKDGKCVVCGNSIEVSPRKGINPALYKDPFCSGTCARKWHKVTDSGKEV